MPSSLDDAMAPLVPGSGSTRHNKTTATRRGMLTNRILTGVLFLILVGVSIFYQFELQAFSKRLALDEDKIQDLQTTVDLQATVIERFNTSITNSDVLDRLTALETNLKDTSADLRHKLRDTEDTISDKLNLTLNKLGKTVKEAQDEIEEEVDKVKKDVESYVRTTQDQFSMENSFMVYQLAGTFTLLSGLISMWHMTAHLRKFNQPVVQRKILAILWMSPIYAITSWFSLVFHSAEGYLMIIKDFYEAYIIYQFLSFCIAVLGKGNREAVVDLLARHASHLSPPFQCCGCCCPTKYENDRHLADAVLMQCQRFAMQFVFLRPLTSIAMFVLEKMDCYGLGDSPTDYRSPQFYIIGLQNLSVFVAFAGLLKFYHAVDKDLAWCRPFAKFLCIKGVVFMTFWQGLAISILATTTDVGGNDQDEWAKSAQNFLICLEMLLFSIAHFYTYPTEEWEEGYQASHESGKFGDSIALGDFLQDLKVVLRSSKKRHRKKPSEPTVPEEGEGDDDKDSEAQGGKSVTSGSSYDGGDEEIGLDAILEDADADDPEVKEAAERLRSSKILSVDDQFQDSHEDVETAEAGGATYGSSSGASQGLQGEEQPPTETTGLLSGTDSAESLRSENEEMLRPSIFTTVSKLSFK